VARSRWPARWECLPGAGCGWSSRGGVGKLDGWLLVLLWLRFGAGVQGVADGVADAPLGAASRPAQRQELACWALAFEMGEPFAVELIGELV
jgi:hypothetical protein